MNQQVALHSVQHNTFLSVPANGKNVNFKATTIGPNEIFNVFYEGNNCILQSVATGKYITVLRNGKLECLVDKIGGFEKLQISQATSDDVKGPNQFNLKSYHGKFLSAQPNGDLIADRDKAKGYELFEFYYPQSQGYGGQFGPAYAQAGGPHGHHHHHGPGF